MKVFIVILGEYCEGGRVMGVYKNKEDAKKKALSIDSCFPDGWLPDGPDCWGNGCDFVRIEEWDIE